jgi:hypothetical protein
MAFGGRGEQGAAVARVHRIHRGAMLEQQLDAGNVVIGDAGGGDQCRLAVGGRWLGAAFEQKFGQRPVGGAAGHGQRADARTGQRIDRCGRIEQHRGDAGFGAEDGAVQRRAALGVGGQRTGAVSEQGHHRLGAAVPAVARGGQQGRDAAAGPVHVGAFGDQGAEQPRIGQQRGQHQYRTLVAIIGCRRGVRIGAGFDQGERAIDVALARGGQQGVGLFGRAGGALALVQLHYDGRPSGNGFDRLGCGRRCGRLHVFRAQQRAQRAVGDDQTAQRQQHDAVDGQCRDARLRRQHAVQAGQRHRAEGQHQQGQRCRQVMAEETFLVRQVPAKGEAAQGRGENPRAVALRRVGVVPHEHQPERRPQPPQRRQRQHQGGGENQRGAEARRMTQLQHWPRHQRKHQHGIAGKHHQMRRASAQNRAAKMRLGIEADRVADRGHRQRVGQQERD